MRTVYNVTFFYPPQLEGAVRRWLAEVWIPAATVASGARPMALALEQTQPDVESTAVQSVYATDGDARKFAETRVVELIDDMQRRFGAQSVMAFPSIMTEVEL